MLNDATCFKKIFIVTGYTDLRSGIDRLADTIRSYLGEDAIEADFEIHDLLSEREESFLKEKNFFAEKSFLTMRNVLNELLR